MAALIVMSVLLGTTKIPLWDVVASVFAGLGFGDETATPMQRIVFDLRLPRALFSAIIGGWVASGPMGSTAVTVEVGE